MREVPDDLYLTDASFIVGDDDPSPDPADDEDDDDDDSDEPSGESDGSTGADGGTDGPGGAPNPDCDFTGRWIATERRVASGLGVKQAGIYWLYFEFTQSGDKLTVSKGLICGTVVKPIDALSAAVDFRASFPKMMSENPLAGVTGKVSTSSGGCSFRVNRFYSIMGATAAHYRDPKLPMPTVDQKADGSTPGWEDWDNDGMPGITLHVSGIVNGTRSEAIRSYSEYNGTVPKGATKFSVPLDWNQDEAVLAVSSEALKATGGKEANKSLHFVQFVKLAADQATGSDADICQAIRSLSPKLTPDADK